jgi:hypothetical protein
MASKFNISISRNTVFFCVVGFVCMATSASGQLFKKSKKKQESNSTYAYQTYSTFKRKHMLKGYAGDEPRFYMEKPKTMVPIGKGSRIRVSPHPRKPYMSGSLTGIKPRKSRSNN